MYTIKNSAGMLLLVMASHLMIFISCSSTSSTQIKFGYMQCLNLDSNETWMQAIDSISLKEYENLCCYEGNEIWLNRVIIGKNKSFIGMSTRLAAQEFISILKNDSSASLFLSREYSNNEKLFHAFFLKKSGYFVYRTVYSEPKQGDLLIYDITNKDSAEIANLYNDDQYMIKKLNCE